MTPARRTGWMMLALGAAFVGGLTLLVIRQCGPGAWVRGINTLGQNVTGSLAEEKKFEPRVMIRTVQGAGTLIVHTVRFEFSDPQTKFARRTGKVTASAEIEYAVDLSGLDDKSFTNIDQSRGRFTIRLRPPRPHNPRVESINCGDIRLDGFKGYTLGLFTTDQAFRDEAGQAVQAVFDKRLNDPTDRADAKSNAVRMLNRLYAPTGWQCEVEWLNEP